LARENHYLCSSEKEQKIFMSKQGTIIVVDDNKGVLSAVKLLLKNHFEHIVTLPSPITLPAALREENAQVVLLDMNFSSGLNTGNEGLYWLHEIKKIHPSLPVVLFTAYADIDLAVRGIKEGATDFIVKPWDNARLIETLLSACRNSSKNKKRAEIPKTVSSMYWGESNAMKQLRTLIEKVAQTDANILITGENGTGKEMLAREIHALSNRYRRDMITVDMGAITESLFESELFGHKKGSFTDAHTDRAGKFEAAHEGTLFLDEIGNLPFHLQAKLLTAIQQKAVVKVGSNLPIPVNIRLICATNRNLPDMVKRGEFREDLLYRINTIHLEIPPLRQRTEDILPLAEQFICRFCQQYHKKSLKLPDDSCEKLLKHPWYGNIRELEHTIEKAVIICDGTTLTTDCFQLAHSPARTTTMELPQVSTLEAMERQMIAKTLQNCEGNLSAVAASLGISRQTLYNKMKRYGL
jgi:two-component system response regulator HydG